MATQDTKQRIIERIINQEVFTNASQFVSDLVNDERYIEDLLPACIGYYPDLETHEDKAPEREALQHWLVSDWLADQLEDVSALVARDVLGFEIWGRTECGQGLDQDSDLSRVADAVMERRRNFTVNTA